MKQSPAKATGSGKGNGAPDGMKLGAAMSLLLLRHFSGEVADTAKIDPTLELMTTRIGRIIPTLSGARWETRGLTAQIAGRGPRAY